MEDGKRTELPKAKALKAKAAVISVGEGRGFVIKHGHDRLVVTAAHCLPRNDEGQLLIPAIGGISHVEERTYARLLARLGRKPSIWAECLFADPVSDLAVLGEPDGQVLSDEADAYRRLMEAVTPIAITDAPKSGPAWLLLLDGNWFSCTVKTVGHGPLWLSHAAEHIKGGMSGSPVISADGMAMGIVCTGSGPNARLTSHLPGWLLCDPQYQRAASKTRMRRSAETLPMVFAGSNQRRSPVEAIEVEGGTIGSLPGRSYPIAMFVPGTRPGEGDRMASRRSRSAV